ncbi:MAG: Clp1/GlmU family protein [Euryarchaeota archaeon]|nr:Clp1/GlmU family protein [Euryarchaeota archaeon]
MDGKEEKEWEGIVKRILKKKQCKTLILGHIDTGKTSFLNYASEKIKKNGKKVSIMDCDIGQSTIGPPGCLGLLNDNGKEFYYFIGDVYPYDHTKIITGLLELLSRVDSPYVLIDTTGLVFWKGRSLKKAKITTVNPDLIIAFQRENELEGILGDFPQYEILREPVKNAKFTSREKRRRIRKTLWKKYLKDAELRIFKVEDTELRNTFLFSGKKCGKSSIKKKLGKLYWCERIPEGYFVVADRYGKEKNMTILRKGFERGLTMGFIRNNICISIGTVMGIDFERKELYILTSVENDFDFIEFGRIRVDEKGEEMGRVYNLIY